MKIRKTLIAVASLALFVGCSGSDGADGKNGVDGQPGQDGRDGEDGQDGQDGQNSSASVSGVFPGAAFLGQTLEVTLSGFATEWDASSTLSFGDGVTVSDVRVASPTALIATIQIGMGAAEGRRDVRVTSGSEELVYTGGFQVSSPIAVEVLGDAAQGSIAVVEITNLDRSRAFDTTMTGDGFFTPIDYPNVDVLAPLGTAFQVEEVTATKVSGILLIDGDFTPGTISLTVVSGTGSSPDTFPAPDVVDIAARTATEISADHTVSGLAALASEYLQIVPASGTHIVDVTASSGFLAGLFNTGRFAQVSGTGSRLSHAGDDALHAVLWNSTSATASVDLTVNTIPATGFTEDEPNASDAEATALTLPAVVQGATFSSPTDEDWFSFTASAADVGKTLYITTYGVQGTDTMIEVYDAGGLVAASTDGGYLDTLSYTIAQEGELWVNILPSDSGYYMPAYNAYRLSLHVD